MNLTLDWNPRDLERFSGRAAARAVARAVKRSGNESLRAMRAEAKRAIRNRTRIRAGFLADKALPLTFPKGSNLDDLVWTMRVSGTPVPLGEYPRRQTKKGVVVEVIRSQSKLLQSAFLAMSKSGRKGVFLLPTEKRYPMGHRLGLSAADSFKDGKAAEAAFTRARDVFTRRFDYFWGLELSKL